MIRKVLLALILSPFFLFGQSSTVPVKATGINFIDGLSWKEVVAKATAEKKNIVIDCYTTWCVPCKKMEKEVFSQQKVGEFFNQHFICYRLQLDSTKNDNDEVKKRYADAEWIRKEFQVYSYPTVLFLSPEGKLLERSVGLIDTAAFMQIGRQLLDPNRNYYALLEKYNQGERNRDAMRVIAITASKLNDTVTASKISKDYLSRLKSGEYLRKDNIEFFQLFTKTSRDVGFNVFYNNVDSINKLMQDNMYAQSLLNYVIITEMVLPSWRMAEKTGIEPDWNSLHQNIRKKYNRYAADFAIASMQPDWYRSKKQYRKLASALVNYAEHYLLPETRGAYAPLILNNHAWDVFNYSEKREELEKALTWSGKAVLLQPSPNWMDTYANILYKLGKVDLAIQWQQIAVKLVGLDGDPAFRKNLKLMQEGKNTWPEIQSP
jgi:thioredoxin-related protein